MNPEELADFLVAETRRYVDLANERTATELKAAFAEMLRTLPAPEPGRPGKDFDLDAVKGVIHDEVQAQSIAEGISLRSTIPERVAEAVAEAMALLPAPKDGEPGKDADVAQVMASVTALIRESEARITAANADTIRSAVAEAVAAIPIPKNGEDGKDADVEEVRAALANAVAELEGRLATDILNDVVPGIDAGIARAVASIPPPQKGDPGKDVDVAEVRALIDLRVAKAVEALPVAKDGVSITGALVDRAGSLVLTLSTGATVDVGRVVGKDAEPAEPGKPGRDGFGFEDLAVEYDGERTVTVVFQQGDHVKRFPLLFPVVLDRRVYGAGKTYEKGDAVSWGGSLWIAQEQTSEKPDDGKTAWRLAVKKGRDFRPADRPARPA